MVLQSSTVSFTQLYKPAAVAPAAKSLCFVLHSVLLDKKRNNLRPLSMVLVLQTLIMGEPSWDRFAVSQRLQHDKGAAFITLEMSPCMWGVVKACL